MDAKRMPKSKRANIRTRALAPVIASLSDDTLAGLSEAIAAYYEWLLAAMEATTAEMLKRTAKRTKAAKRGGRKAR